ncbi:hypothetical protein HQ45_01860 [Porphyromonas crevioricanis]|uniref:Probable 2-phosphosulfolactate phosphatase n=2 Tax=Porphyromonas crevioricanis TaxID=393921 RepID=A0A0A2G3G7_9PORP|nr:2-phosphosulfolactate phosphatase [Porphyromonas crevioricanis]KGN90885.1 hypothetical protein HQ45_01860 [Porphyromonas crevioricanis]KGN95034.1 hypothetical protein HQ38_04385 [Porphyromonas crevioricanis]SJZ53802.1 2-phosphosulfolactate phosphatase [Porphyromonas crevioricanis]SQH73262.1 Probable 2-phosphosulfolactate phosphatase [Porphyromonas crevioricanis]GAD06242.1 probable 2-phosphosulfolactate phosphatase [Porphyromonas crevioricanis JCM 15906]
MRIDLCCSAPQFKAYFRKENPQIVLVIDVLRASSSICAALGNRAHEIIIVAQLEEALRYKEAGWLVGAERHAKRCSFAQFGNSPFDYKMEQVQGQSIVFSTTNGTKCVDVAFKTGAKEVLIGAYVNLPTIVRYLSDRTERDVLVLAAGWEDTVGAEDCLFAGALAWNMEKIGICCSLGDSARMMRDLWISECAEGENLLDYIRQSEHYQRMECAGVAQDVPFCLVPQPEAVLPIVRSVDGRYICTSN